MFLLDFYDFKIDMHACNAFENDMKYVSCVTFYFYERQQQREPELKERMNMQKKNKIT